MPTSCLEIFCGCLFINHYLFTICDHLHVWCHTISAVQRVLLNNLRINKSIVVLTCCLFPWGFWVVQILGAKYDVCCRVSSHTSMGPASCSCSMFSASCYKRAHAAQLGIQPQLLLAHHHFPQRTKKRAKRKKRRRRKGKKRRQVPKNSRNSSPRVRQHATRAVCSR